MTAVPTNLTAVSDMAAKAVIIRRIHRSTSSDSAVIIRRKPRSPSVGIHRFTPSSDPHDFLKTLKIFEPYGTAIQRARRDGAVVAASTPWVPRQVEGQAELHGAAIQGWLPPSELI